MHGLDRLATPTPPAPLPLNLWRRVVLALLLLGHAGLAVHAANRILALPAPWNDQPLEWAKAMAGTAVVLLLAVWRWPHHAAGATSLVVLALAMMLLTPGAVCTVALCLASGIVIGKWLLERVAGSAAVPLPVAALSGIAVTIGAFALAVRWRIHSPAMHVGLALLMLVLGRNQLRRLAGTAWGQLTQPRHVTTTERGWIVVAGIVAVLHLIIAAKPEVGYDASTLHLQLPELIAAQRSFRHDVGRYLWASMPLGADYAFATAYLMGSESAARALNLAFGGLACALAYRLAASFATREAALACVTLFAAMPLATLVTGFLFSETLWTAFLLAALVVVVEGSAARVSLLPALALVAGGAMATKVLSLPWLSILVPYAIWAHQTRGRAGEPLRIRGWLVVALGVAIGAWPYADAWLRTGNPVFPFMNTLFGSPLFDTATAFNNPAYNTPLSWRTPWEIVLQSGRFIEGHDGALGLAWLFAIPLVTIAFTMRRARSQWLVLVLMVFFFTFIFVQQSYLRYLLPAFALCAILASIALGEATRTGVARGMLLAAGIALVALDVRLVGAAHYANATPCLWCSQDARARAEYVATYAPLRAVAAKLNRELPEARIGFMILNAPAPAGYVGVSRSANWHDHPFFSRLRLAATADEIEALVRDHQLTHVVLSARASKGNDPIAQFARRRTTPLWRIDDYVVAVVQPRGGH